MLDDLISFGISIILLVVGVFLIGGGYIFYVNIMPYLDWQNIAYMTQLAIGIVFIVVLVAFIYSFVLLGHWVIGKISHERKAENPSTYVFVNGHKQPGLPEQQSLESVFNLETLSPEKRARVIRALTEIPELQFPMIPQSLGQKDKDYGNFS